MIPGATVPGAILVAHLWWYAYAVLRPAQILKAAGLFRGPEIGHWPARTSDGGAGPYYSRLYSSPVMLDHRPSHYETVHAFDLLSGLHDELQGPFSAPIFEEVVKWLRKLTTPQSRILDCSCGGGTEALALTRLVPEGEVVGVDLAERMVSTAAQRANRHGVRNVAFFQADVANLPEQFHRQFDIVYCAFSFHHYADPIKALREMWRVLVPGGHAFVVDPGPKWMKMLGAPLAKWADPGWVAFYTGDEFQRLFRQAGFSSFYWEEVLPGIGLSVGTT